ncbi:MAG: hypothetical protein WBQ68_05575 [Terriglobales bacterium]
MRHEHIVWNPAIQEWFCIRCGQTSDLPVEKDARNELEQRQCHVPWVEMPQAFSKSPGD